jgi:hypothetical protein
VSAQPLTFSLLRRTYVVRPARVAETNPKGRIRPFVFYHGVGRSGLWLALLLNSCVGCVGGTLISTNAIFYELQPRDLLAAPAKGGLQRRGAAGECPDGLSELRNCTRLYYPPIYPVRQRLPKGMSTGRGTC